METTTVSAAPLLAEMIRKDRDDASATVIVGPDHESRNWAEAVASEVGAPCTVLKKIRSGDKSVSVSLSDDTAIAGKHVYLVDDVASTGETLSAAARLLKSEGAQQIEAVIAHALFDEESYSQMRVAGVTRIQSTDSVRHPTNAIEVAPLLAETLLQEIAQ